jgi:hypothetical protein
MGPAVADSRVQAARPEHDSGLLHQHPQGSVLWRAVAPPPFRTGACLHASRRWRYLEHDWIATPGDYAFERPGETHTLVVPDDVKEMATLFDVTGGYTYVDPYGEALGYEDVFTKLEHATRHYEAVGLGKDQ